MAGYFIRRIIGAVVKLLFLSFILFYLVVELPLHLITPRETHCPHCRVPTPEELIRYEAYTQYYERMLHIDKPWPLNYVDWLFDPADTTTPTSYDILGNIITQRPKGINVSIGNLQIKGSGVLIGDLGVSLNIDQGKPVSDMFGPGIGEMFAFLSTLTAALMALVAAQRWSRPQPYRVSALPTASSLARWWQQHARSPIDVAIIGRQWG